MSTPVQIGSLVSGSEFRVRTLASGLLFLMALFFAIAVITEPGPSFHGMAPSIR